VQRCVVHLVRAALKCDMDKDLALRHTSHNAVANLRAMRAEFPIYSTLGFLDSVDVSAAPGSAYTLVVDQQMNMTSIANALADDAMHHAVSDGPIEQVIRPLDAQEPFSRRTEWRVTCRLAPSHFFGTDRRVG
jgi:hypothetical protein